MSDRLDITIGAYEFHRDDKGTVTIIDRDTDGRRPEVVIIPADIWQHIIEESQS